MTEQKITDMTAKEAKKFFGEKLWKEMSDTGLLTGITCKLNNEKEMVIYKCDLENALHAVRTGRELFWD